LLDLNDGISLMEFSNKLKQEFLKCPENYRNVEKAEVTVYFEETGQLNLNVLQTK